VADSWILLLHELPSGRIAIDGLPADRHERMSLTYRLLDVIRAVQHADTGDDLSDGQAWQKYAKSAYVHGFLLGEDELAVICLHCGRAGPDGNHCRACLWSVHRVDNDSWPAFRWSACGGLMRPVAASGGTVTHRCERCGQESRARLA